MYTQRHKYRCTDRMCGCPDCPTCHPENFRNGHYIDEEREAEEQDARDMEADPVGYLIRVAEESLQPGPQWSVDDAKKRLREAIEAAKQAVS